MSHRATQRATDSRFVFWVGTPGRIISDSPMCKERNGRQTYSMVNLNDAGLTPTFRMT
jgi:hypothetical protein